tara:strand:- start:11779 stop:12801 length:1023 start_codon:yes stop_codon:yes gene_type:complete
MNHESDYADIGQFDLPEFKNHFEIGAHGEVVSEPVLTGVRNYQVKNGELITSAQVYVPESKRYLFIVVKTPITPDTEIGWGWSDIKRGAKGALKSATKKAKKVATKSLNKIVKSKTFRKATKRMSNAGNYLKTKAANVLTNPYVMKVAQGAAVASALYLGVPPTVSIAATGLLFAAMSGDAPSMAKIQNIAIQAAAGSDAAVKAKAVLSTVYNSGLKEMQPYINKAKTAKAEAKGYLKAGQAKALNAINDAKAKAAAVEVPGGFSKSDIPNGAFPFTLPGVDMGEPIVGFIPSDSESSVSGFYYNTPYRSNLEAKSLDLFGKQKNPFHALRALYHTGLKG